MSCMAEVCVCEEGVYSSSPVSRAIKKKPFWIWEIEAECDSSLAVDKRLSDSVEEEGKAGDMI